MAKKVARMVAAEMLAGRSDLYRWLRDNRADIEPLLHPRPSWQAVANAAAKMGVRTAVGTEPSRWAVRKAWLSLERDLAAPGAGASEGKPAAAVQPLPPSPQPGEHPGAQEAPARHRFIGKPAEMIGVQKSKKEQS